MSSIQPSSNLRQLRSPGRPAAGGRATTPGGGQRWPVHCGALAHGAFPPTRGTAVSGHQNVPAQGRKDLVAPPGSPEPAGHPRAKLASSSLGIPQPIRPPRISIDRNLGDPTSHVTDRPLLRQDGFTDRPRNTVFGHSFLRMMVRHIIAMPVGGRQQGPVANALSPDVSTGGMRRHPGQVTWRELVKRREDTGPH